MPTLPRHLVTGNNAETHALSYLVQQGLSLVESNYRCRPGEIDLVMKENGTLVFVEVRYRADQSYGGGLESIDARKQRKLRAAAMHYLQQRHGSMEVDCRFDVVLISGSLDNDKDNTGGVELDWIPNAL